jgi:hypothetical protein
MACIGILNLGRPLERIQHYSKISHCQFSPFKVFLLCGVAFSTFRCWQLILEPWQQSVVVVNLVMTEMGGA